MSDLDPRDFATHGASAPAQVLCTVVNDAPWLLPYSAQDLRGALLCMLDVARAVGVTLPPCEDFAVPPTGATHAACADEDSRTLPEDLMPCLVFAACGGQEAGQNGELTTELAMGQDAVPSLVAEASVLPGGVAALLSSGEGADACSKACGGQQSRRGDCSGGEYSAGQHQQGDCSGGSCGEKISCAGGFAAAALELYVLRDGAMAQENLRCMGCQGATNVLSFPPACGMPAALLLSADAVRREALLYGQDVGEHTLRLLAHGLGHVLGYDHGEAMDALCARMHQAACHFMSV